MNIYIIDISAGARHSAALSSSGAVYLWGEGKNHCTFQSTVEHINYPMPVASQIIGAEKIVRVSCGDALTVLITVNRKQFTNPKVR